MSMSHQAFAFDWDAFRRELHAPLIRALESNQGDELVGWLDGNRALLKDPYEGEPLPPGWRPKAAGDVQELGDYALTRFYDPSSAFGLGHAWLTLGDALPEKLQAALLGTPIGPAHHRFDPGRMGSYFQTPMQVGENLKLLRCSDRLLEAAVGESGTEAIQPFLKLVEECFRLGQGLYVTF